MNYTNKITAMMAALTLCACSEDTKTKEPPMTEEERPDQSSAPDQSSEPDQSSAPDQSSEPDQSNEPDQGVAECVFDADCQVGFVCNVELGLCVEPCADATDCAMGERCAPRASAPGSTDKICQPDPSGGQCQRDDECDADERCQSGACVQIEPTTVYRYILIQDVSSGNSACDSTSASGLKDAGADIFSVELVDAQGEVIGYGQAVDYSPGAGDVDTSDFGILNGQPLNLDARECPAAENGASFRADSVVSLGCGGYLLLNFAGIDDQAVNLENGANIFVGEYAPICTISAGSAEGSDRYDVFICLDTQSAANASVTSCTRQLGSTRGGSGNFNINGL